MKPKHNWVVFLPKPSQARRCYNCGRLEDQYGPSDWRVRPGQEGHIRPKDWDCGWECAEEDATPIRTNLIP